MKAPRAPTSMPFLCASPVRPSEGGEQVQVGLKHRGPGNFQAAAAQLRAALPAAAMSGKLLPWAEHQAMSCPPS